MINDYNNLIRSLDEKCRLIIGNDFQLKRYQSDSHKLLIFHNNGTVKAVNRLGGDADSEVNVYPWFSTYYLYVEVKFVFDTKIFKRKPGIVIAQCSISISVFKLLSEKVIQLFRAEWDDYDNERVRHPQPHWHITSDISLANTFNEYAKEFGEDGFMSILKPEKEQIASLRKFHFAMKGKWEEDMSHSTSIESSKQVVDWFCGLLSSIRTELEYIDNN